MFCFCVTHEQGVYVEGARLVGGHWVDGKVVPHDAAMEQERTGEEQLFTLALSVSHSAPTCGAVSWVTVTIGDTNSSHSHATRESRELVK